MSVVSCPSPSRADLRRENIKGVARRLFIENGFHATGIALIAKQSGVAVQQLYRDFPAKEDIIAAIVEEDCERYADLATLDAALIDQDRLGIRKWLTSAPCGKDQDADQLFLEIFAEASRNPRINSIVSNVRHTMFENVSRAFAGLDGSPVVGEQHFRLAEALMIVSSGSICARSLNGKSVDLVCDMLVEQLLKNGMPVDQTP